MLFPTRLSDLLFDLHLEGLYKARWTKTIEAEVKRNFGTVVLSRGQGKGSKTSQIQAEHIAKAEKRLSCFRAAVSFHEVLLYDTDEYMSKVPSKVDKGDKHVASAAIVLSTLAREERKRPATASFP